MRLQDYQDVADATDLQSLESRLVKFANEMNFGIISGALVIEQGGWSRANVPFGQYATSFLVYVCEYFHRAARSGYAAT